MNDPTETIRRELVQQINAEATERGSLEARYGQVWDTEQLRAEFEVIGFMAPFCVVRRLSDNKKGCLMFQHSPRFYFDFQQDT